VAQWAEERLGERADEVVELLAAHYWSALRYEEEFATDEAALDDLRRRTMRYADAAARRALGVGQFESTKEWLRIVIAQARRLPLDALEFATAVVPYVRLAESEALEARLAVAREAIDRLLALDVLSEEVRKMIADLRGHEAYCAFSSGTDSVDAIRARLESAVELLDGVGPCAERASLNRWLGWLAWRGGPFSAAEEPLRRSIEEAQQVGNERTERWAMHDLGIVLTRSDPNPEGLALMLRSFDLAREAKDVFLVSRCYINVPGTLAAFGRWDEAMALAEEGMEVARRTGDHNAQFWIGSNLADFYHGHGRLPQAIATQEEAMEAAQRIGLQPTSGLPGYAHMLLNAGRFDDARAVWERIDRTDHVVEPQHTALEGVIDAILRWPRDSADAISRVRKTMTRVREDVNGQSMDLLAFYLARMALRAEDTEAVREAAALAAEVTEAAVGNPLSLALARWIEGLARAQDTDDVTGAVQDVVAASDELRANGLILLAADALSDATLLADRHRLPGGNELSARARALYESSSAVPLLDALRSSVC
jgi:tetratricopeptide (TPR) repeat protein